MNVWTIAAAAVLAGCATIAPLAAGPQGKNMQGKT
jgi:hypothetical protein